MCDEKEKEVETPYVFTRYETLLADFWADVENWRW
jgi:hypothetical protein